MHHIYVVLPPVSGDNQFRVDFSPPSPSEFDSSDSPFQFITDRSSAPKGATVIEWSEDVRRLMNQWTRR